MTRLPHVTWLRAFEAASRHGSFAAAAEELNLTPAAVSQQIKLLEQHLGVQLFTRLARGIALSDIGHAYAQPIRKSFAEMQEATSGLFASPQRRVVHVRASISYAALVLSPRLSAFQSLHPDIDIRLTTAVWTDRIEDDAIDVEIRFGHGDWDEPDIRHLGHEFAELVCHPDLAEKTKGPAQFQDLAAQAVQIIGSESDWVSMAEHFGLGLPPKLGAGRVDSSLIALQMVMGGTGAALISTEFTAPYLKLGLLASPLAHRLPLSRSFFLVLHDRAGKRAEVAQFCDWLLGEHKK